MTVPDNLAYTTSGREASAQREEEAKAITVGGAVAGVHRLRAAELATRRSEYAALVYRLVTSGKWDEPTPEDVAAMGASMAALDLTADDVARDRDAIRTALSHSRSVAEHRANLAKARDPEAIQADVAAVDRALVEAARPLQQRKLALQEEARRRAHLGEFVTRAQQALDSLTASSPRVAHTWTT
jgi:hypothetical protein